jgi:hypothetical protein
MHDGEPDDGWDDETLIRHAIRVADQCVTDLDRLAGDTPPAGHGVDWRQPSLYDHDQEG